MPPSRNANSQANFSKSIDLCFDKKRCLMSRQQLALALHNQIVHKHQQGISIDEELRKTLLRKLECTREVGILLEEAKENLGEGSDRWREFSESLPFDRNALKTYLQFSRKHSATVSDLAQAMRCLRESAYATGLLQFPNGRGPERLHAPNFFSRVTHAVQTVAADWRKFTDRKPLSHWSPDLKEQFCSSLQPLVRIYREVISSK